MTVGERPVRDVMSTDLVTCSEQATYAEVARLMRTRRTNGVVVVDAQRRVVGLVSSQSLIRHMLPAYMRGAGFLGALDSPRVFRERVQAVANDPVSSFVTRRVTTVRVDATFIEAAALLADLRQIPVVDDAGVLVGYLSRTHLKNAICDALDG